MQSHFVKLEPPYQIIHYGGVVGIQIGTLIVVGQAYPGPGDQIDIYTRSHPVVSYVDKRQLKSKLGNERSNYGCALCYGGGEGNVWSKVEVNDVDVIGLWDTDQDPATSSISWDDFAMLVDEGFSYSDALKGTYRKSGLFMLKDYLERVGLSLSLPKPKERLQMNLNLMYEKRKDDHRIIKYLSCTEEKANNPSVDVGFCTLYDEKDIDTVVNTIFHFTNQYLSIMRSLDAQVEFSSFDIFNPYELDDANDEKILETIVRRLNDKYEERKRTRSNDRSDEEGLR